MTNGGRDAQPGVAVDTKVDTAVDKAVDGEQPGIRERLARAAFVQFTDRGFDATTVDQIADAAGVSRRTFFRYFKTKEDAIFPAHDRLRASVAADLERRHREPALAAVCASVGLVMADYVSNRDVSLLRFGLTRTVTSLRDREVTSVHRYQRLFVRHLRDHSPELDALTVEVMAASVVTAHNSVLRDWLQGGATGDPMPSLHVALGQVQQLFAGHAGAAPLGKSVIAVFSADAPVADVVTAIEAHAERRASPAPER